MQEQQQQKIDVGLGRIRRAAGYSVEGLFTAYRTEGAFRQEIWVALVLLPLSCWLGRQWWEVALLASSVVMVLITELLNSAIEAVVDRVSTERHELAKRAKDYGSAAVLLMLCVAAGLWITVAWQRFLN
jgi:diacylglycerol kinase (ATP)